jgi:hypothetical protein
MVQKEKRNRAMDKSIFDTRRDLDFNGRAMRTFYDRFVHIEFANKIEESVIEQMKETGVEIPEGIQFQKWLNANEKQFTVYTPETGVKPDISVKVKFLVSERVSQVSVVIKNLEKEIDFGNFAFMRVYMGYFHGPSVMFLGPIMNAYIESPNPNGSTVVQMFDGGFLGPTIIPRKIILSVTPKTGIISCIETVCRNTSTPLHYTRGVSETILEYIDLFQIFATEADIQYGSVKEALDSLMAIWNNFLDSAYIDNTLEQKADMDYALLKYYIGYARLGYASRTDGIFISISTNSLPDEELPTFDFVKSAAFTGGGITVKSVFNPWIKPLDTFFIHPQYFRGRFNSVNVQELQGGNAMTGFALADGSLKDRKVVGVSPDGRYVCTGLDVDFGTFSGNDMIVEGVMATDEEYEKKVKELAALVPDFLDGTTFGADLKAPTIPQNVRPELRVAVEKGENRWSDKSPLELSPLAVELVKEAPNDVFGSTLWKILINPEYGYQDNSPHKDFLYNDKSFNLVNGELAPKDIPGLPKVLEVHYPQIWEGAIWMPRQFAVNKTIFGTKDVLNVDLLVPYLPAGVRVELFERKEANYPIYPKTVKNIIFMYGDKYVGDPYILEFPYPSGSMDVNSFYTSPGSWISFMHKFLTAARCPDVYNKYREAVDNVKKKVRNFDISVTSIALLASYCTQTKWRPSKESETLIDRIPCGCVDAYDLDYLQIVDKLGYNYKVTFYFPDFTAMMKYDPDVPKILMLFAEWCVNSKLHSYEKYAKELMDDAYKIEHLEGVSL